MADDRIALLRGINVGGRNKVLMADLRTAFEAFGATDVETYIQSGNVAFRGGGPVRGMENRLADMLEDHFGFPIPVLCRTHDQVRATVAGAPDGFGEDPDTYRDDVLFLKDDLTAERVLEVLDPREGVDRLWPGEGVVYSSRLAARATQSRLSKIASTPEYQSMTIRNWRTTNTLLDMLEARG